MCLGEVRISTYVRLVYVLMPDSLMCDGRNLYSAWGGEGYGRQREGDGLRKKSIVLFNIDSSGSYTVDCDFL